MTSFLQSMRQKDVTGAKWNVILIALFGIVLWSAPLICYVLGYTHTTENNIERRIWLTNIVVHCLVGIMVGVDAMCFSGTYWPWQLWVIGLATFTTFTLPALLGMYLARDDDDGALLTLLALALVCLSNAAMVSIIFEFFHRGITLASNSCQQKHVTHSRSITVSEERKRADRR